MSRWTPQRVQDAAAAWVWVPDDADAVRTDEYHLIRYPSHYVMPTQVAWSRTSRPADAVIDEVANQVRNWRLDKVDWWVSSATSPADTEEALLSRGATVVDVVDVLGYDMSTGAPAFDVPPDVRVELVRDMAAVRAAAVVGVEVWDAPPPDEAKLSRELDGVNRSLADWSGFQVVGFLAGEPVAFGGCTLADGVARLWGAATRPPWRHRGAYRAVLEHRMRIASQHGATLALVRGRVETSGPILRRLGFERYGEERCYRLPVT